MKIAKQRIIFNNYDVSDAYENAKQFLIEEGNEEPTDDEIWDQVRWDEECNWGVEKDMLDDFFKDKIVGFFGEIGRWDRVYKGGRIGDFWDCYYKAISDCDYIKIYDENGHMYLTCSHHDGTCHFEIKIVSDKGTQYLNNWEYSYSNRKTKEQIYTQIFNRYSFLPRFAEKVYGCKAREFEEPTKEKLIKKLNDKAMSFYS